MKPIAKARAVEQRGPVVTRVPIPARALITDTMDKALKGIRDGGDGAIVRIRPPPEASDEDVEAARKWWIDLGAARVFVEPRRRKAVVPNDALEKPRPARSTAREVVLALVEEANTEDRAALTAVTERLMGEHGL